MNPIDPHPVSIEKEHYEEGMIKNENPVAQLAPNEKRHVWKTQSCLSPPERILVITFIEYSRDQILMRKDNIAHFMLVHCEISTPICQ